MDINKYITEEKFDPRENKNIIDFNNLRVKKYFHSFRECDFYEFFMNNRPITFLNFCIKPENAISISCLKDDYFQVFHYNGIIGKSYKVDQLQELIPLVNKILNEYK